MLFALGLLLVHLWLNAVAAFYDGFWIGVRSIAAAIFPMLITVYIGLLVQVRVPTNASRAPKINNFVIFTLWTMLVLGIDQYVAFLQFPLSELLYSVTLAGLILSYQRRRSLASVVACCYGILCGWLGSLVFFG